MEIEFSWPRDEKNYKLLFSLEGEEALKCKKVHKANILSYVIQDSTKHTSELHCYFFKMILGLKMETRQNSDLLVLGKNKKTVALELDFS